MRNGAPIIGLKSAIQGSCPKTNIPSPDTARAYGTR